MPHRPRLVKKTSYRTGGPPRLDPDAPPLIKSGNPSPIPKVRRQELIEAAARSLFDSGDLDQFQEYVRESRQFGMHNMSPEELWRWYNNNRTAIHIRLGELEQEMILLDPSRQQSQRPGRTDERGDEHLSTVEKIRQRRASNQYRRNKNPASFPDDPLKSRGSDDILMR
jgi:hypothetical protein